jgi:hypothetical protein
MVVIHNYFILLISFTNSGSSEAKFERKLFPLQKGQIYKFPPEKSLDRIPSICYSHIHIYEQTNFSNCGVSR